MYYYALKKKALRRLKFKYIHLIFNVKLSTRLLLRKQKFSEKNCIVELTCIIICECPCGAAVPSKQNVSQKLQ